MDLNVDVKDLKEPIMQFFAKLGKKSTESEQNIPQKKQSKFLNNALKPLNKLLGNYSYSHEKILGVDITPHYIRVCQMQNSYGKWVLSNLASSCMENQFRNIDIHTQSDIYVENLKNLVKANKISTKDVAFSLPASSSIVKIINMPEMDADDFKQAAALGGIWESMVNLEGAASEYSIYYKILSHNDAIEPAIEEYTNSAEPTHTIQSVAADTPEHITPQTDMQPIQDIAIPTENVSIPQEIVPSAMPEMTQDQSQILQAPTEDVLPTPDVTNDIPQEITADIAEVSPLLEQAIAPASEEHTVENIAAAPEIAPIINDATITPEIAIDNIAPTEQIIADVAITADTQINYPQEAPIPQTIPASMDVLFVATKLADIQAQEIIIKRAGLNPILADIRFLALKHALENDEKNLQETSKPYGFIEFGPDDNYLFVVDGDNTQNYNIFMSDDDKNNIIYNAHTPDVISAFVQNFAGQLQQLLQTHETTYNSGNIHNIFVSSTAPLHVNEASTPPIIKSFVEIISTMFSNRKITECNFCDYINVPEKFSKQVNAEGNIASWAATVGIASRKLDVFSHEKGLQALARINLLPQAKLDKNNKKIGILSTLAASLVLFAFGFMLLNNYASTNSTHNDLQNEVKTMDDVEQKHSSIHVEAQKLTITMRKVNSLGDIQSSLPSNQKSILSAYEHITSIIPEGIWLKEVTYALPNTVEIIGNSLNDHSILDFVEKLNEGTKFKKIALRTMVTKKKSELKNINVPSGSQIKEFTLAGKVMDSAVMEGIKLLSSEAKHGN